MLLEVRFVFHAIFGCVPCDVRCVFLSKCGVCSLRSAVCYPCEVRCVFLAKCGVRSLRSAVCYPCEVRYVILAMCGVADTDIDIHTEEWV